jgi:salicylate hydroxylase
MQVGAGIQIPPNSARLLQRWGTDRYLLKHAVEPSDIIFRRWKTGDAIGKTKLVPDFRHKYYAPYWVVHRAHLHQALATHAAELGVSIQLNAKVESYKESEGSVLLFGGAIESADLVVAADGTPDVVLVASRLTMLRRYQIRR